MRLVFPGFPFGEPAVITILVAFFCELGSFRRRDRVIEEHVGGLEFFRDDGNYAPGKGELSPNALVRRHSQNIDGGTEAGHHARGTAAAGAYDHQFRADVDRHRASSVRDRVQRAPDFEFRVAEALRIIDLRLGRLGDAVMVFTVSTGYFPIAVSPGKHDGARAVVHGVGHIRDLRSRGAGIDDHGFQHFGSP